MFTLEAVGLGDLEAMMVSINQGHEWHVQRIAIQPGIFAPVEFVAVPNR